MGPIATAPRIGRGLPSRRLEADERHAQLVAAGLALLKETSLDAVSASAVARAAGVSKALVFHYFPRNRDLHGAVLRAAVAEMLAGLDIGPRVAPTDRLRLGIEAFLAFIEHNPGVYQAIARGAGADPTLLEVFEEARAGVVAIVRDGLALERLPPGLELAVRGWVAMVEEVVLHWLAGKPVPRQAIVDYLHRAALSLLPASLSLDANGDADPDLSPGVPGR